LVFSHDVHFCEIVIKLIHVIIFLVFSFQMSILKIFARQILDSRGNPTVEVDVTTKHGRFMILKYKFYNLAINILI